MFSRPRLLVRPAGPADRGTVTGLSRWAPHVHSHLDWRAPEDWLDQQPFLLAERGRRAVAALACPPDPPHTAWVRLLAVAQREAPADAWQALWDVARSDLETRGARGAAGLSMEPWTEPLYAAAGFERTHHVVVLARERAPLSARVTAQARLRPVRAGEDDVVAQTDAAAFAPPWQTSPALIRVAIAQADYLSVADVDGHVVGYQLTTASREGAHLARLAIRPDWQGRGIGHALVADVIEHYQRRGTPWLTVNTQDSNMASLKVYQRLGFRLSGTRYPVFQLALA